jgi:hypothetical protein
VTRIAPAASHVKTKKFNTDFIELTVKKAFFPLERTAAVVLLLVIRNCDIFASRANVW